MSTVRLRRLQADYEKLRTFLCRQPRIRLIQVQGTPPERYQLEFQIRGLREVDGQLQAVANHIVEIALPLNYPRLPPQCRMLTPVFHPNIAPHAICIGDHWNAGEPLWSMVARIGEMITYQSYNTKSPLNGEAARWVQSHLSELPLDKTNFMLDDVQPQLDGSGPQAPPMAIPLAATPRPAPSAPAAPGPTSPCVVAAPSAAPRIVVRCGQCGARYSVPPAAAGKKVQCKKCQAILQIPPSSPRL